MATQERINACKDLLAACGQALDEARFATEQNDLQLAQRWLDAAQRLNHMAEEAAWRLEGERLVIKDRGISAEGYLLVETEAGSEFWQ